MHLHAPRNNPLGFHDRYELPTKNICWENHSRVGYERLSQLKLVFILWSPLGKLGSFRLSPTIKVRLLAPVKSCTGHFVSEPYVFVCLFRFEGELISSPNSASRVLPVERSFDVNFLLTYYKPVFGPLPPPFWSLLPQILSHQWVY